MDKVDDYIVKNKRWSNELNLIRSILQSTELVEDFKWTVPTYTLNKKNVLGMACFKKYVGIWFFQGVFLKDKHNLLVNAQTDKTKGLRQLRYRSIDEINIEVVKDYVLEAIENQKKGLEIKVERTKVQDIVIPEELKAQFEIVDGLKDAYNNLTPGKQKDYSFYISSAKQDKTKLSRLRKITPMIMNGVGLHDKYK